MSTSYAENSHYDPTETPEHGLEVIQAERRRRGILAAALFTAATLAAAAFVYLAYTDVPAPTHPANAKPGLGTPYR